MDNEKPEIAPQDRIADIKELSRSRKLYLMAFNVAFPGWLLARVITDLLPEDTKIIGCDRDIMSGSNCLCFWSDQFEPVAENVQLPMLTVNVTVTAEKEIERVFLTEYNYQTKKSEERSWRQKEPQNQEK